MHKGQLSNIYLENDDLLYIGRVGDKALKKYFNVILHK
jgi:hypothetical protein